MDPRGVNRGIIADIDGEEDAQPVQAQLDDEKRQAVLDNKQIQDKKEEEKNQDALRKFIASKIMVAVDRMQADELELKEENGKLTATSTSVLHGGNLPGSEDLLSDKIEDAEDETFQFVPFVGKGGTRKALLRAKCGVAVFNESESINADNYSERHRVLRSLYASYYVKYPDEEIIFYTSEIKDNELKSLPGRIDAANPDACDPQRP